VIELLQTIKPPTDKSVHAHTTGPAEHHGGATRLEHMFDYLCGGD
jgi:hypothetical protein